jgi:hypothetical protein
MWICSTCSVTAQLWSISTTTIQVRFRLQLNSMLFAKTLVRKDSASTAPPKDKKDGEEKDTKDEEDDFSSKAQIMTLMTTDVDRVSEFAWHFFTLVGKLVLVQFLMILKLIYAPTDSPIELVIGTMFLYKLLGTFFLCS